MKISAQQSVEGMGCLLQNNSAKIQNYYTFTDAFTKEELKETPGIFILSNQPETTQCFIN